jgi:3-dehydroquinate synthase II
VDDADVSKGRLEQAVKAGIRRVMVKGGGDGSASAYVKVIGSEGEGARATWVRVGGAEDVRSAVKMSSEQDTLVVVECPDWKVIPLENLVAEFRRINRPLFAFIKESEDIGLAFTILEKGVNGVVVTPESIDAARSILVSSRGRQIRLSPARVVRIVDAGIGDRVCVDTISQLSVGEGMLVGSRANFFFLVHSESVPTEYIPTRPFRVNAGALHSYLLVDEQRTRYLSELESGDKVMVVGVDGRRRETVVGRVKIERRPMIFVEAEVENDRASVILQKAETIRLVRPNGEAVGVMGLKVGEEVLVHLNKIKARHLGGEVDEFVIER